MDIEQKKIDLKEDIAGSPATLVLARISICDEVQLSDLMKVQFTSYFRGSAGNVVEEAAQLNSNTTVDLSSTGVGKVMVGMTISGSGIPASTTVVAVISDTRITISNAATNSTGNVELTFGHPHTLHDVCINLAKQRALLEGANVGTIMKFNIAVPSTYTTNGTLTFPQFEDSTQGNKTTFPFITLHDFTDAGGQITLSTSSNANTTITNDDGTTTKYFTDFSKYFLTRSRANGELISVDENTSPYMSPSVPEPFLPPSTINGESFLGTAAEPTANSDVRYEYSLVANTDAVAGGHIGGGYDLAENLYVGNTYVWMEVSNVVGTFSATETLTDFANNTSTIKSAANTSTVLLETFDTVGTFVAGELLTDRGTNATVFSTQTAGSLVNITLTGSTFDTGSDASITLGFPTSDTITLDTNSVSRTGSTVTVQTTDEHGILSGERIVLKGADDIYDEFNGIFEVGDTTANTLTFTTTNSGSINPTGNFSMVKNVVFGRTSNAAGAVRTRTVNATANIVFQSTDLSVGYAVANTISGGTSGATGVIDSRNNKGDWYQTRTNEVKVFNTGTGTWTIDAAANTGEFWNKNFEPVRISTVIPTSGTGSNTVAAKMKLTKALATSGDTSGGYDSTAITKLPGTYFSYPLKTWANQVHSGVTTLEAYDNFANVVIAPEGLEVNFNWLPLGLGNNGTDLNQNGTVDTAAHNAVEVTTLDKTEFESKLGSYGSVAVQNAAGNFPNAPDDVFLSSIPANRSSSKKVGTSGAVYPKANANPFFPSIGGTHKTGPGPGITANTSDGITGTQPGGLDANSIYAGSYTEVQTGALDPPPQTEPQTIKMNNRYIIQNDLKWTYASNPFDANTSAGGSSTYNAPQTAAYHPLFDGSLDTEIGHVVTETSAGPGASTGSSAGTVDGNKIGINVAGSCPTDGTSPANKITYSVGALTINSINYASIMRIKTEACVVNVAASCSNSAGNASQSACEGLNPAGTWTAATYHFNPAATNQEVSCAYNRVQQFLTAAGATVSVGSASGMQANMAILYTLLLNLLSDSYGTKYIDPNEPSGADDYTEPGRSDVSFRKETQDMKKAIDDLIVAHGTYKSTISGHTWTGYFYRNTGTNGKTYLQCLTGATAGSDGVKSVNAEITSYRVAVKNRLAEITNRIGCLNGKYTGGTGGSQSFAVAVGSAGNGFAGYAFNGGAGYANTVYSHANFLAGKKIKLIAKILGAVEDVDAIYTQIESKRSEYYEYNQ